VRVPSRVRRRAFGALVVVMALAVAGTVALARPASSPESNPVAGVATRSQSLSKGLHGRTLEVAGVSRQYLLYVPRTIQRPAPLVLAFHGLHQSAAWMASRTGLVAAAERAHVVLALPDGLHGAWNDGRLGPDGPDDVRFATALVSGLIGTGLVDGRRVTVAGFSNGAELALVLASRYPRMFSALVSVSGQLPALPGAPRPQHPIPAYFTHGTADPVQPWPGRPAGNRLHPALLSEDATIAAFVAANRASPTPRRMPTGSADVQELMWPADPGGVPVVLYRLVGAGHGWPTAGPTCRLSVCGHRLNAAALVMQVARGS
jgi:polyhydroxybutyrate depolymerase